MEVAKDLKNGKLVLSVSGRLDTVTSPRLQAEIDSSIVGVNELVFDFAALDYISSAGLRVLLAANKRLASVNAKMAISGANSVVREVFEMTGFSDIFTLI